MATPEMGMADYFLQGFGSMLPDNHPARADLMQAPRLGKEKHTGLVAYELAELAVDWLQELVGEEGGDKKLLTIFRLPMSIWRGGVGGYSTPGRPAHCRRRQQNTPSKCRNCSRRVAFFQRPNERARASMSCTSAGSR